MTFIEQLTRGDNEADCVHFECIMYTLKEKNWCFDRSENAIKAVAVLMVQSEYDAVMPLEKAAAACY